MSGVRRFAVHAGVILLGWLAGACDKAPPVATRGGPMEPPAFWVWHRNSPLTEVERKSLPPGGTLYWQVAECEWRNGRWHSVEIAGRVGALPGRSVVPVVRLKPVTGFLGRREVAAKGLANQIRDGWGEPGGLAEIQLDFDCPDRLLGEYAAFLTELGRQLAPTRVSITALAGWPLRPQFDQLARSVVALMPMFYDLAADSPAAVVAGRFQPLADPATARLIERWQSCPVRWLAGLPNFQRVSVFEADGKLVGHLRGWAHDPLVFQPALVGRAAGPGVTDYAVSAAVSLADLRVVPGQRVVWRTVEGDALAVLAATAERVGAAGVVYFALPGPGLQAAFSPRQLQQGRGADPLLDLKVTARGELLLNNSGPVDLPARACDPARPDQPGWQLEMRGARRGAFRDASPGGFAMSRTAAGLPAEETAGLVLYFSGLPSGGSIRSGACIVEPEAVTWRVVGASGWVPLVAATGVGR